MSVNTAPLDPVRKMENTESEINIPAKIFKVFLWHKKIQKRMGNL